MHNRQCTHRGKISNRKVGQCLQIQSTWTYNRPSGQVLATLFASSKVSDKPTIQTRELAGVGRVMTA